MRRTTSFLTTAAAVAVAVSGLAMPAHAEAVVYEKQTVSTKSNDDSTREYATLAIPTGYDKHRIDRHTVGFFEMVDGGRAIIMDLEPEVNTVKEIKAQRAELVEEGGAAYEEFAFKVNDQDAKVRVFWSYSYETPGTEEVDPFTNVMLMSGNRLHVVGKLAEREHVEEIRKHVVKSVKFPG